ncbi:MAG TPA: NAD-binding protein, partial [Nitrolancea sp.]|nr:NAD-binding protein [Nitrolancea sp.]
MRTAVLVGGSLATAGEFSFLLARLGVDLGVLTMDVFSVMLTGAAGSILVAPPLQAGIEPAMRWLERRWPVSSLSILPELENPDQELRGHAVIYGYGRVGRVIGDALRRRDFSFVVVDNDLRVVRQARAEGVIALLGEADNPVLMEQVRLKRARALVVAIPDPLGTRLAVDYARRINPQLEIVVRALNAAERTVLANAGVTETVVGELELAFEMTRFTLRRFGVSTLEAQAVVQRMRLRYEEGEDQHEHYRELE